MAKYTWPRDVTPADRAAHSNDAVQLPVLERLGLVESMLIPARSRRLCRTVRRYSLTAKGRRYYLRKSIHDEAQGQPVEHDADFCVAHLSLDMVVKWTPPEQVHGHLETLVRYTYHVKPADWMADPEARQVFPVADRIIRGQGNMLMTVTVRLQDGQWMSVMPGQ